MEHNDKRNKTGRTAQMTGLYPCKRGFVPARPAVTGGIIPAAEPIEYNTGRRTVRLQVRNTGDRPIQVGSHFHFFEVNRYLEFDRYAAFGCHLNIPATTAVRFEPGDSKTVELVTYSGKRRVIGFNNLVMGYTGDEDAPGYFPARTYAFMRVRSAGFKISGENGQNGENAGSEYGGSTSSEDNGSAPQQTQTRTRRRQRPAASHRETAGTRTAAARTPKKSVKQQTEK